MDIGDRTQLAKALNISPGMVADLMKHDLLLVNGSAVILESPALKRIGKVQHRKRANAEWQEERGDMFETRYYRLSQTTRRVLRWLECWHGNREPFEATRLNAVEDLRQAPMM